MKVLTVEKMRRRIWKSLLDFTRSRCREARTGERWNLCWKHFERAGGSLVTQPSGLMRSYSSQAWTWWRCGPTMTQTDTFLFSWCVSMEKDKCRDGSWRLPEAQERFRRDESHPSGPELHQTGAFPSSQLLLVSTEQRNKTSLKGVNTWLKREWMMSNK